MVFCAIPLFFLNYSAHPRHRFHIIQLRHQQPEPIKEIAVDFPELVLLHLLLKQITDVKKKVTILSRDQRNRCRFNAIWFHTVNSFFIAPSTNATVAGSVSRVV